jgi:peptide/nickel transport system permease protein
VVIVEVVFVYPGIGQTMVDAVRNRDYPVVQACALIFAATYILVNLLADIVTIATNPRLLYPR